MEQIENNGFDMIGALLMSYGLTGENIARKIFSYLDIFPLTKALYVSQTWRHFLLKDRNFWLKIIAEAMSDLERLNQKFPRGKDACQSFMTWKILYNCVTEAGTIFDILGVSI